ncbi:unnamed protein product [Prunus armeniaca]|uniref:Uncharacterized protein n=1 Tax=Prunus armeniaca TaxID=36596 RepID=A0A6J5XT03_PRUAR|nr:unnamed protein product [Prunus armeniaca]
MVKLSFGHKIPKPEELKGKTRPCRSTPSHSLHLSSTWSTLSSGPNIGKFVGQRKERKTFKPEPVPCSRCKYEIGQLKSPENKTKAAEPSQPTMKKFDGQYDRRPANRAIFDRLGARNPSTSAGHKDEAAPRLVKTFKPPVVRDDRWYHARPGAAPNR